MSLNGSCWLHVERTSWIHWFEWNIMLTFSSIWFFFFLISNYHGILNDICGLCYISIGQHRSRKTSGLGGVYLGLNEWVRFEQGGMGGHSRCYIDWMSVWPLRFICWHFNPYMMLLGGGAFGRWLLLEGRALMNGILLLFSCSVMSNSFWPHGPQHTSFPVHHHLPELAVTHVHWVDSAIQPSCLLSFPSSPVFNLSQHQGLF